MKYMGLLFICLIAFTVAISYVIIGEGEIFNIVDISETEDMHSENEGEIEAEVGAESEIEMGNTPMYPADFDLKTQEAKIEGNINLSEISSVTVYDTENNSEFVQEIDEYLCGVVFAEMPSGFEIEALKAQAVAARSFCVYKMLNPSDSDISAHGNADICTDPAHCKAYISYEEACAERGEDYILPLWEKVYKAVAETTGEIIEYNSEPAIAVFHAMSNQSTESAENIWGGAVPYLVSVATPESENSEDIRNFMTTGVFTSDEFKSKLLENGFRCEFSDTPSAWISDISLNSSGRTDELKICGKAVTGKRLREVFSLRSTDFTLVYNEIEDCFIFTVKGYGHGVGMSQYGANLMAKDGEDYKSILQWYYAGVDVVNMYE